MRIGCLAGGGISVALKVRRGRDSIRADVFAELGAIDGGGDLGKPHVVVAATKLLRDGWKEAKGEGRGAGGGGAGRGHLLDLLR